MKKYISIIAVLSLFVIGCSEQSSINSPVDNVNTAEPNWITLPQPDGMQINTDLTVCKSINGAVGGTLETGTSYVATARTSSLASVRVTVKAKIVFSPGAFVGKKSITMTVSDQNTSVLFGPSMQFSSQVVYNVTYTGLDLTGIDASMIDFAYLAADGSVQIAVHNGITVDQLTGTLSVSNAVIPHFSRYGFINKAGQTIFDPNSF
ncbi:MAG: hypothetical protein HXY50_12050 [Ignavibacteriaceae bacterium]|nr:hypothetical protein [Ignavibacteriaceae bacterium]